MPAGSHASRQPCQPVSLSAMPAPGSAIRFRGLIRRRRIFKKPRNYRLVSELPAGSYEAFLGMAYAKKSYCDMYNS